MHNSYNKLSLRQLHAKLTREHELFLKALAEHEPKEFLNQVSGEIENLFIAINARINAFKKFGASCIDLQSKEAFWKVLV